MSYSRWLDSAWYTFWACYYNGPEKDKQLFEICPYATFTYREIKDDIDGCIKKLKRMMIEQHQKQSIFAAHPDRFSEAEWEELKGYMQEFINDVESDTSLT
jgi:hypothetical protein